METMHAAGRRRLPPVPRSAGERSSAGQLAVTTDEQDVDQFATQVIDTRQIAADLIEAELIEAELIEAELAALSDAAADESTDETAQLTLSELTALLADDAPAAESDEQVEVDDATDVLAALDLDASTDASTDASVDTSTDAPTDAESDVDVAPSDLEPAVGEQDPAQQFVARLRSSATDFAGAAGAESAVVREAVPPARHRRARCRLALRYADGDFVDVTLLGPAGAPGRPSRHGFDRQILRWLGAGLAQDAAWIVEDPDAPEGLAVDLTAWVAAG
jgi:hypothetical protein